MSETITSPDSIAQAAIESYYERGWTDGMPVVPVTAERLEQFLAQTGRDPAETLMEMPHLTRKLTVKSAALNAVLAGCLPEYFPIVVAAWRSLAELGMGRNALWQSTTGSAPLLLVNGPVADELEINSRGNIFGSGFRANATIGRAIRLGAINVFGLKPHLLDQATQASPAKYACTFAENEAMSPWPSLTADYGFGDESTVTTMSVRGTLFMEARHTSAPEQLLFDLAESASRTGRLVTSSGSECIVLSPEHAHVLADAGWSKTDVKRFLHENSVRTTEQLDRVGKGGVSFRTHWRIPIDHPDAVHTTPEERGPIHTIASPDDVHVVVAGADNAGVSTILDLMMAGSRLTVTPVEPPPAG